MACRRCGRETDHFHCDLCSSIVKEQAERREREDEDREDLVEQLREIADARFNPGDYDCTECGYRTLKYLARCCPTCRSEVPDWYWNSVAEKQEAERKAKEEEWHRGRPAREAAEKARQDLDRKRKASQHGSGFWIVYWMWPLPTLSLITYGVFAGVFSYWGWSATPVLNWFLALIMVLGSMSERAKVNGGDIRVLLGCFAFWGALGMAYHRTRSAKLQG
jgi:hypothetical protein